MNTSHIYSFSRICVILFAALLLTDKALAEAGHCCGTAKNLHIYLLIGQTEMAGRAEIPEEASQTLERCYLLNEKNEWEPAKVPLNRHSGAGKEADLQHLGPGFSFARKMLEKNKDISIGLIVNAGGGSDITPWTAAKPKSYWSARKRTKQALADGTLKGILWHQDKQPAAKPGSQLTTLIELIANLRSDFGDTSIPFVTGQIYDSPVANTDIAKLPETVHGSGYASADGLTTKDGMHFDTRSQLLLGQRYAEQMILLQKQQKISNPASAPTDIKFIDTHVHAMALKEGGLEAVSKWMDDRNVDRCIVSPLNHKGSRAWTEEERELRRKMYAKYKGKIDRMCIIDPGEVESVEQAVKILQREKQDGAVAFGEHYGKGLMFDDPKNLLLYDACERVGLPVMFHIDQNKNMVEKGMKRVDNVLKKYPKCKVIAHAYWWRQLGNGSCDRQLQEHPNLYADTSGHVVVNVLNRDRKYAREFIIRNADKLLFGTDEGWWSFKDRNKQMKLHYTFFEELNLPDDVRYKLYRGNAEKLFGWKRQSKD
ncbi:MAG: sialate O-acetylesterase [Akkermansiaceae bacterium]